MVVIGQPTATVASASGLPAVVLGVLVVGVCALLAVLLHRALRRRAALRRGTAGPASTSLPDMSPAEAGLLRRRHFSAADLTATILDLAVRGHLRIEHTHRGVRLVRTRTAETPLRPYEKEVLEAVFAEGEIVPFGPRSKAAVDGRRALTAALRCVLLVERAWLHALPRGRLSVLWVILAVVALVNLVPGYLFWQLLARPHPMVTGALWTGIGACIVAAALVRARTRTRLGRAAYRRVEQIRQHLLRLGTMPSVAVAETDLPWAVALDVPGVIGLWDQVGASARWYTAPVSGGTAGGVGVGSGAWLTATLETMPGSDSGGGFDGGGFDGGGFDGGGFGGGGDGGGFGGGGDSGGGGGGG